MNAKRLQRIQKNHTKRRVRRRIQDMYNYTRYIYGSPYTYTTITSGTNATGTFKW